MHVNREKFLKELAAVGPGLATREILEQSSCFVFNNGSVMTFNDEISCSKEMESKLSVRGAVKAAPLVDLLDKLEEDSIDIKQSKVELEIVGIRRKAGIRMEAEVLLPVEAVEKPEVWNTLDSDFNEAISIVHGCASGEESNFALTCIHIHPDYIEACDRFQLARYTLNTGVDSPILVKADSLKKILGFGMKEVSETGSWIHFRNSENLVISIRRYQDEYISLDQHLQDDDCNPISLPGSLEETVNKAEIFSSENAAGNSIIVGLRSNQIMIKGEGASGWFMETKDISYSGPDLRFMIAPRLLVETAKKSSSCRVSKDKLFIDGGKFKYASCTSRKQAVESK